MKHTRDREEKVTNEINEEWERLTMGEERFTNDEIKTLIANLMNRIIEKHEWRTK